MAEAIYLLCMLTSIACVVLLGRAYLRTRARMLLWSSLCFVGLTINNLFLFLDLVVFPSVDFGPARDISAIVSAALLVFGLIWDSD